MKKIDGKSFARTFDQEWTSHRWQGTDGASSVSSKIWTDNLYRILLKTTKHFELRPDRELRRIDLTFYDEDNEPVLAVEHENGWRGIWQEEVPKLVASAAFLRVLICYPPKKEHWSVGKKLESTLPKSSRTELNHEFLLVMGIPTMSTDGEFTFYWYHSALKVSRLRV